MKLSFLHEAIDKSQVQALVKRLNANPELRPGLPELLTPDDVLPHVIAANPISPDGRYSDTYAPWIMKQWKFGNIRLPQDSLDVRYILRMFEMAKRVNHPMIEKDIFRYRKFQDLREAILRVKEELEAYKSSRQTGKATKAEGSEAVYDDEDWRIIRLYTGDAASIYANNTRWCTSDPETAVEYMSEGALYIVFQKTEEGLKKIAQYHPVTRSLMDLTDKELQLPDALGDAPGSTLFNLKRILRTLPEEGGITINGVRYGSNRNLNSNKSAMGAVNVKGIIEQDKAPVYGDFDDVEGTPEAFVIRGVAFVQYETLELWWDDYIWDETYYYEWMGEEEKEFAKEWVFPGIERNMDPAVLEAWKGLSDDERDDLFGDIVRENDMETNTELDDEFQYGPSVSMDFRLPNIRGEFDIDLWFAGEIGKELIDKASYYDKYGLPNPDQMKLPFNSKQDAVPVQNSGYYGLA